MPEISLLELFLTFFYIGLFTIGGGLVAITLMQQTIVEKGFISVDEFYNMIAISESTPGPVGVNMATFLGYKFYRTHTELRGNLALRIKRRAMRTGKRSMCSSLGRTFQGRESIRYWSI